MWSSMQGVMSLNEDRRQIWLLGPASIRHSCTILVMLLENVLKMFILVHSANIEVNYHLNSKGIKVFWRPGKGWLVIAFPVYNSSSLRLSHADKSILWAYAIALWRRLLCRILLLCNITGHTVVISAAFTCIYSLYLQPCISAVRVVIEGGYARTP